MLGLSLWTDAKAYAFRPTQKKRIVMRVTLSMLLALLIMLGTLASAAGLANAYDLRNSKGYPICDHGDC